MSGRSSEVAHKHAPRVLLPFGQHRTCPKPQLLAEADLGLGIHEEVENELHLGLVAWNGSALDLVAERTATEVSPPDLPNANLLFKLEPQKPLVE